MVGGGIHKVSQSCAFRRAQQQCDENEPSWFRFQELTEGVPQHFACFSRGFLFAYINRIFVIILLFLTDRSPTIGGNTMELQQCLSSGLVMGSISYKSRLDLSPVIFR